MTPTPQDREKARVIVHDLCQPDGDCYVQEHLPNTGWKLTDAIAQALAQARAEEREACAKVAERWLQTKPVNGTQTEKIIASAMCISGEDIAEAIRARTEPASSEE